MPSKLDVVIAGGGRVGLETTRLLSDRGHDVTVVERDPDRCRAISDEYLATVIEGDASNPELLEQASVDRADVVAALTGVAGLNLAVCMEASEMSPDTRTVARIDSPEKETYERFVDAVLYPESAGARIAANEIVGSDVQSLADVTGDLDILQVRVREGAPAAGKRLSEVRFPSGALVVSGEGGDQVARPDTELTAGEAYVVAVEHNVADEVMNLLHG